MNLSNKIVPAPHVVARAVAQETVLLDLESGTYFSLDTVGAHIWGMIEKGKSLNQICDAMLEEFDVTRDVLEHDTLALAKELADKKLVIVE
jgi:hypothetical protein